MPAFRYKTIKTDGVESAGEIQASDREAAMRLLTGRGELPTELDAVKDHAGTGESGGLSISLGRSKKTLSRPEVANLVRELATALEAGLPLMQGLQTVRRQGTANSQQILDFLIEKVEAGMPLHQACAEYGAPFDDMIIGMMRAADASGQMSEVLHQLADLLDRSVELRRELVSATVYPMIVAVLIAISVVVLVTFLLPTLLEPLEGQPGFTMPWPTQFLLSMATFIETWWLVIILLVITAFFAWRAWIRIPRNKLLFDGLLLKMPLLGRVLRDVAVARFTRTLGTLVSAGIPILTALKIVRDTLGNTVLMQAIDMVQEKVSTGGSLADPLERCGHFPPLLVQIVNIGERSGRLESMLMHAAKAFDRQVNNSLKIFSKALPPILLAVMAVIAAFVLAAILLPLLEMQSAIGG
ncbi:MAG: hypothetical protein CMJ32_10710 [Phycisphaerae bacterium]|nr:hypothetical protein [Phycisphaerae bacterium]